MLLNNPRIYAKKMDCPTLYRLLHISVRNNFSSIRKGTLFRRLYCGVLDHHKSLVDVSYYGKHGVNKS